MIIKLMIRLAAALMVSSPLIFKVQIEAAENKEQMESVRPLTNSSIESVSSTMVFSEKLSDLGSIYANYCSLKSQMRARLNTLLIDKEINLDNQKEALFIAEQFNDKKLIVRITDYEEEYAHPSLITAVPLELLHKIIMDMDLKNPKDFLPLCYTSKSLQEILASVPCHFDFLGSKWNEKNLQKIPVVFPSTQSLKIGNCSSVSNRGFEYVSQLSALKYLDLSCCDQITDEELKHIGNLTSLTHLGIYTVPITGQALEYIAQLSNLTDLTLCNCEKIQDGFESIAKLTKLTRLSLRHTQITSSALNNITSLTLLNTLSLYGCRQITDDGFESIISFINLTDLNLEYTKITGNVLVHLGQLTNLSRLELPRFMNPTNADLQYLTSLKKLIFLKLSYYEQITEEERRTFETSLPRTRIEY